MKWQRLDPRITTTCNGNDLTHALLVLFIGQETKLKDEYLQWSDNQVVRGTIYNLKVEV
jgi:hypothetical protein